MKLILNHEYTTEITHIAIHYEVDGQYININLDYNILLLAIKTQ